MGDTVPPVTPREGERELSRQPPWKVVLAAGVPAPVITTSSKCRFSIARNSVWVFICLDGVFQLQASRRVSELAGGRHMEESCLATKIPVIGANPLQG